MENRNLINKIKSKTAKIGVIGLGYVGLPLALEFALKGFEVSGFDIDENKIMFLSQGKTYIKHIASLKIREAVESGKLIATTDFSELSEVDAVIICVPTPLNEHREPDMTYIVNTAKEIQKYLRKGQFISLESTTYPGTTEEILLPMMEEAPVVQGKSKKSKVQSEEEQGQSSKLNEMKSRGTREKVQSEGEQGKSEKLKVKSEEESEPYNHTAIQPSSDLVERFTVGKDFFLAFCPEREDPNNPKYSTSNIPKVVGGITHECLEIAQELYNSIVIETIPVSSAKAAEATKLLENIYRSVNIALVNELKMVFDRMGVDIWEVIGAASTKPFGFNPFYPGPGLGGHCIPIDPFYLTWKAREYDINTKFIELAGEINTFQPYYVVEKTAEALNKIEKSLNGSKILLLGAAYKKDIDDMRESPSLKLIEIFREKGAEVSYNDPYVPRLPKTRKYKFDMQSVELTVKNLKSFDVIVLSTDHSSYDYRYIAENSKLIVDTRNAFEKAGIIGDKIFKG